jgi:hypothetical protein
LNLWPFMRQQRIMPRFIDEVYEETPPSRRRCPRNDGVQLAG